MVIVLDEYGNLIGFFNTKKDAENYIDDIDPQGIKSYQIFTSNFLN